MIDIAKIETKNFVIKSNTLIEARYRLSLQESRIILWLLTQIGIEDEDFKSHKLDIAEFAELVQVDVESKYRELRKITKQLMQRVMEIYEPMTQDYIQVAWLSSAHYKSGQGHVLLEFSPKLKPYLLQLKSHFTKIEIVDTLKLKSIHAIRIFELLIQYSALGSRNMSISDLRLYCGINQNEYSLYADLKRKVIEKARSEINSKTEYDVNYIEIKESRRVVAVKWIIHKKDIVEQKHLERLNAIKKELRSERIIVDNLLEYGFSKTTIKRFITVHGEDTIKNAIRAVDLQVEKGKAKNPKAMIRIAIEEKWHPEIFKAKKK